MINRTHPRLRTGALQRKEGLLPKYIHPTDLVMVEDIHHGPVFIFSKMGGTLICDIDGTLADLTHRRPYVSGPVEDRDYGKFEKLMGEDTVIDVIAWAVRRLYYDGWTILLCSGRGEHKRSITEHWLFWNDIPYHRMYMRREFLIEESGAAKLKRGRAQKDYRNDAIVKEELLDQILADGYDPDIVFDDRNAVVEMWRRREIPCVQVAEGDF